MTGIVLEEAEPSYADCTQEIFHKGFFTTCVQCVELRCQVMSCTCSFFRAEPQIGWSLVLLRT